MGRSRLSKQDRKKVKEFRRRRKNQRSVNAGEYGTGKTEDRPDKRTQNGKMKEIKYEYSR